MGHLRAGTPLDKTIDIGSLIAPSQHERVRRLVEIGVKEGATCYQPDIALPPGGSYFPPTLLTNVHPASTVAGEEIFGPVLVAMTFRTHDEAITIANNSRYGLAASVWSETIGLALAVRALSPEKNVSATAGSKARLGGSWTSSTPHAAPGPAISARKASSSASQPASRAAWVIAFGSLTAKANPGGTLAAQRV